MWSYQWHSACHTYDGPYVTPFTHTLPCEKLCRFPLNLISWYVSVCVWKKTVGFTGEYVHEERSVWSIVHATVLDSITFYPCYLWPRICDGDGWMSGSVSLRLKRSWMPDDGFLLLFIRILLLENLLGSYHQPSRILEDLCGSGAEQPVQGKAAFSLSPHLPSIPHEQYSRGRGLH